MPRNVQEERPWDLKLRQSLISYYRNLVEVEFNDPIPLRSSFLGVRESELTDPDLASSSRSIPSLGSCGIFENGIPFYHMHTQTLTSKENKRIEDNQVRLKVGKFSQIEDDQIRKNWRDYCEISGTDPSEASYFTGCSSDRHKKKGSKYFRAWMCRALPDRSGVQVYRRCQIIFHSCIDDGVEYTRPWSAKELKILALLGPSGRWADIGAKLNRPRYHCQKQYVQTMQEGAGNDDEEEVDLKLLYKIGMDPVKAFVNGHLDLLEQNINWEQMGETLSMKSKRCRKLFKRLKRDMIRAGENITEVDPDKKITKVRKALPKSCRRISRIQNKKKSKVRLPPKQFSKYVKALLIHHKKEIECLKKPYKFSKTFVDSEALADFDEKARISVLRRLTYIMSTFQERGVFDFLPLEHWNVTTKMKMIAYVMKKIYYTRVKTTQAFELGKRFIEKQGWKASRSVHALKLDEGHSERIQ